MNREEEFVYAKSTETQAFFNFLKSVFGIGIIALPYLSQQAGYLWAIPLMIFIMYCCTQSTIYLLQIADDLEATDLLYTDVVRIVFNKRWGDFVDFLLVLSQIAICILYLIFLVQFFQSNLALQGIEVSKLTLFAVALVPLVPLTMISKIHFFHQTSSLGTILAVTGIMITVINGWVQVYFYEAPLHFEEPVKIMDTFAFIGSAVLAFEGVPTVLPIRDSMIDKLRFKPMFIKLMFIYLGFIIIIQISLVTTYGPALHHMLMFSIENRFWMFVASICYATAILLTYPVQLFPVFQIMEIILKNRSYSEILEKDEEDTTVQVFTTDPLSLLVRLVVTIIIFASAYFVPDFSVFLNLIGSVLGTLLQYIVPCLLHASYFSKRCTVYNTTVYWVILPFSGITMILGLANSISNFSNSGSII